jgi:hypothetical protein
VDTNTGTNSNVRVRNNGSGQVYGHFLGGHNYGGMPAGTWQLTETGHLPLISPDPAPWPDEYCPYEWDYEFQQWVCMSPIIIATGSSRDYTLTSAEDGVLFDMNGDGVPRKIAWTKAGSEIAFLVRDLNGDGRITSGKELFGNFTVSGASNGFAALAELQFAESGVRRGDITSDDPLFATLLLWTDRNHNGASEPDELRPFGEQFSAIGLGYRQHNRRDGFGNRFAFEGFVLLRTEPGRNPTKNGRDARLRNLPVYDVYLAGVK